MITTTGLSLPMCRFVVTSRTGRGVHDMKPFEGTCVHGVPITAIFKSRNGMSNTVAEMHNDYRTRGSDDSRSSLCSVFFRSLELGPPRNRSRLCRACTVRGRCRDLGDINPRGRSIQTELSRMAALCLPPISLK